MLRVVIDTNIVVSALLRAGGLPHAVFNLAIGGMVQPCLSATILAEYEEVLRRPRLGIDSNRVDVALAQLRRAGMLVQPRRIAAAASDPDDDIFLECAAEAQAQFLVTGNLGDFPAEAWEGVQIVTARQFLGEFSGLR